MNELVRKQDAIDAINNYFGFSIEEEYGSAVQEVINGLPSAQPELEDKIRAIGYTGKEGRIYIGGRLFAVRELAQ